MRGPGAPGPSQARPPQAGEVRLLAKAYLVAGLVAGATAVIPFSDHAPRGLAVVLLGVALVLAGVLWWGAPRLGTAALHGFVAFATACISLSVALSATPAGLQVTTVSYVWVALYSATVHRGRALAAHLGLIGTGLAVALVVAGAPSAPQTWFFVMATVTGVAWALNRKVGQLRQEATRDPLTGVLSRRALLDHARREAARSRRTGSPATLLLLDLDGFKHVNDSLGHAAGDAVLVELTNGWGSVLRRGDALGRLGGDEFAVVLTGTDRAGTDDVVARLRAVSDACAWSWGAATWDGEDLPEWFARADAELYLSKVSR